MREEDVGAAGGLYPVQVDRLALLHLLLVQHVAAVAVLALTWHPPLHQAGHLRDELGALCTAAGGWGRQEGSEAMGQWWVHEPKQL